MESSILSESTLFLSSVEANVRVEVIDGTLEEGRVMERESDVS